MKKKKFEAKLTKARKKLAKAQTELDALLALIDASGMPKAAEKPFTGTKPAPKAAAPAKKPTAKPAAKKPVVKPAAKAAGSAKKQGAMRVTIKKATPKKPAASRTAK